METNTCIKCSETKSTTLFEKGRNVCKKCRLEQITASRNSKRVREVKVITKTCELCMETKSANEYHKFSLSSDGLNKLCKPCSKKKRHKKKKRDAIIQHDDTKNLICGKCNVQKPCSSFRTNKRALSGYFTTCNECWKPSEITKERMREYDKRYREKHPEKLKEKYKKQGQKLHRRIKDRMRARITCALSSINYKKANHTIDYMGCSINYLKKWLEHQFVEGMSWDNYSEWQIDHVIPCDSFDISKESEQMKCFNWKNLRPCWTRENLEKGAKVIPELIDAQQKLSEEFEKINPLPTQPGDRVEGTE